jgi:uncharacterized phage-associated protein
MLIPFNAIKVAQAGAVLVKTERVHRMSRLRLLKLLYIADRESLVERSRPITGDRPVAMDHGPVLSQTYDLIKGTDYLSPTWEKYLRTEGRDVVLGEDPGVGKLSRYEIRKLNEVALRFAQENDWDVAEYTHTFAEWQKNKPSFKSSNAISLDDLLEATGLSDRKAQLLEVEKAEGAMQRLLGPEAA